ncbi:MAG: phosphate signaling complex protein PhoU, partial [Bdellovibrionales bacterium]|nr:phosphate signaling complex protein PhoU [Bdellovibrionales bacterium]
MIRFLDTELQELKDCLLEMGGTVEKAMEEACEAALKRKPGMVDQVLALEARINELHLRVDQNCLELLAKQAPVARDLRLVLAIIKMNTDLERMGDQASNIAYTAKDYLEFESLPEFTKDFTAMVEEVRSMVKDCLDAFVRRDVDLCRNVLSRDDIVDQY